MTTNVLSSAARSTSSSSTHDRRRLRSVGAVFAGLATIFAITTLTDVALHTTGVYPAPGADMSHGLYALAAAYRVVYGVLGCYVTARLAPARPFAHSIALGIIGTLISTAGRDRHVGRRTRLVSARRHRDGPAVRLGGREAAPGAAIRTAALRATHPEGIGRSDGGFGKDTAA